MDETIGIALALTLVIAAITGASFAQGLGIFVVMFIVAAAFVSMHYANSQSKSTDDGKLPSSDSFSSGIECYREQEEVIETQQPRQVSNSLPLEVPHYHQQYELGERYCCGKDGINQDYVKAAEYYAEAAGQGFKPAYRKLGLLYAEGKGVPVDYAKAIQCYTLSKAHSHSPVEREIRRLEKLLTPTQADLLNQMKIEEARNGLKARRKSPCTP